MRVRRWVQVNVCDVFALIRAIFVEKIAQHVVLRFDASLLEKSHMVAFGFVDSILLFAPPACFHYRLPLE